jgi:hypothetical protein
MAQIAPHRFKAHPLVLKEFRGMIRTVSSRKCMICGQRFGARIHTNRFDFRGVGPGTTIARKRPESDDIGVPSSE